MEIEDVGDHSVRVNVAGSVSVLVDNSIGCRMVDVLSVKTGDTIEPIIKAVGLGAAVVDTPIVDTAVVDAAFFGSVVVETGADKLVVDTAFNVFEVDVSDCSAVDLSMVDVDETDADELKLRAPSQ